MVPNTYSKLPNALHLSSFKIRLHLELCNTLAILFSIQVFH